MNDRINDASAAYLVDEKLLTSSHSRAVGNPVPAGFKQTEIGLIPEDWMIVKLEEIASYRNGAAHENCIDESGDFVVVNSKFISTGGGVVKNSKQCRQPAFINEILMVMSDVPNGRAIAKCYLVSENNKYTVNQRICAIQPEKVEPRYLFYKLNRNLFYLSFDDGAKQTNLRRQDVLDCPVPVPSYEEQTAIANALSDVDELIDSLEALIAKKQAIKTATMQQLLTGRTRLPQFAKRPDGKLKGTKHSELGEIPEDWEVKQFSDVLTRINTKKHQISSDDYMTNGLIPVVDQGKKSIAGYSDSTEKTFHVDGDGVIVFGDHTCFVKYVAFDFLIGADGVQVIKSKTAKSTKFFSYLLSHYEVESTGYNRHFSILKEKSYPIPSTDEEKTSIATTLSDMDVEIQTLGQRLVKNRQIKQGMMQELLTGRTRLVQPELVNA